VLASEPSSAAFVVWIHIVYYDLTSCPIPQRMALFFV
jgi:hypothetical protein